MHGDDVKPGNRAVLPVATHLLQPANAVEAQGGQPRQQRRPVRLRNAVRQDPAIEQVIGDSADGRVTAVLGSQQNWLVALRNFNAEKLEI